MEKRTKLKLAIERFLVEQVWVYLVIICSALFCAWLFDRWIESLLFIIAHIVIRRVFDKQFHFNKTALCVSLTLAIVWFAIPITMPLTISLLSSIPIAFLICFFGYLAQDRVDAKKDIKDLERYVLELVRKINYKDIYSMNEEELYNHCRSCGLNEDDCKIAYFVIIERLQGKELYEALPYYAPITIKRRRVKIMAKIKEQPKNKTTIVEKH